MEQYSQYLMSVIKSNSSSIPMNTCSSRKYSSSWEEEAFAEDGRRGPLGGFVWPPRSYSCSFCRREFNSAQALGGHMNVHRRQKAAKLKQLHQTSSTTVLNHHHQAANSNNNTLLVTSTDRLKNHIKEEMSICESSFDPPAAAGFSPSSKVSSLTALLGSTQDQSLHHSSTTSDTKSCVFEEDILILAHDHGNINGHDLHVETNLVLGFHLDSSSCSDNTDAKKQKTNHDTALPIMAGTLDLELRLAR